MEPQSSWHLKYVPFWASGSVDLSVRQILLEQRYGRAVDWWAFGVLTYEMLLGQSPFRGDDEDEIFDAILEDEPLYPITMPRDAVSILQKVRTATARLNGSQHSLLVVNQGPPTPLGFK